MASAGGNIAHETSKMTTRPTTRQTTAALFKWSLVSLLILASTLGLHGAGHRAKLSLDLVQHESRRSSGRARVIVHGSRMQIEAMAARHHVAIAKFLDDSAVLLANADEITDLASDS